MVTYPLHFKVSTEGTSGIQTPWHVRASAQDQVLTLAVPPEFEGPGNGFSPEDLYALALANCFTATFKVIAEKSRLLYATIDSQGLLTLDRDEKGVPWMKSFHLTVELAGVEDGDRAKRLLEKTSQSCMILNSVKTEKTFEFKVSLR